MNFVAWISFFSQSIVRVNHRTQSPPIVHLCTSSPQGHRVPLGPQSHPKRLEWRIGWVLDDKTRRDLNRPLVLAWPRPSSVSPYHLGQIKERGMALAPVDTGNPLTFYVIIESVPSCWSQLIMQLLGQIYPFGGRWRLFQGSRSLPGHFFSLSRTPNEFSFEQQGTFQETCWMTAQFILAGWLLRRDILTAGAVAATAGE